MPMPTIKEIQKAVEELNEVLPLGDRYYIKAYSHEISLLLSFAESVLTAEWPDGIEPQNIEEYRKDEWYGFAYNQAIERCLLAHLKKTAELREALKMADEHLRRHGVVLFFIMDALGEE